MAPRTAGVPPGARCWTVHVANLNPEMKAEMLRSVFEHFGTTNAKKWRARKTTRRAHRRRALGDWQVASTERCRVA